MSKFVTTNRHGSVMSFFDILKKQIAASKAPPSVPPNEGVKCPRCDGPGERIFGDHSQRWGIACCGEDRCRTTWERKPGDKPEQPAAPAKLTFANLKKSVPET